MGRTVTNVDRTCGPTHLLVFSGNKICLNYKYDNAQLMSILMLICYMFVCNLVLI